MNLAGKFLVIDGADGSGKGTQLDLLEAFVAAQGGRVTRARDPGGTEIGDRIRHVLLGYDLSSMDPRCETLLFMASRAQLVAEVVRPALAEGRTVLCDRFISATCAYQVAAGFPREDVIRAGEWAVGDTWPDLTFVLDVPFEVAAKRIGRSRSNTTHARDASGQMPMFEGAAPDAMEKRSADFHRRVARNYLKLPEFYPRPVVVLDGRLPPADLHAAMIGELDRRF